MHSAETENATAQKLMRAFIQFRKAEWHQRTVAGCSPSEIRVLFCLKRNTQPDAAILKVSEISKLLHVTPPTVTQIIKNLEASGLIERTGDPSDRRVVGITLTKKGDLVTVQATDAFATSLRGLIEYLGEEQSNQLAELLTRVVRYYREKAAWSDDPWLT
jgi:DNA-binding MarR family transcriptional regulator